MFYDYRSLQPTLLAPYATTQPRNNFRLTLELYWRVYKINGAFGQSKLIIGNTHFPSASRPRSAMKRGNESAPAKLKLHAASKKEKDNATL